MKPGAVILRASFQQPTGYLNPLGLTIRGAVAIEVFEHGKRKRWKARTETHTILKDSEGRSSFATAARAQAAAGALFERQVTEWQARKIRKKRRPKK